MTLLEVLLIISIALMYTAWIGITLILIWTFPCYWIGDWVLKILRINMKDNHRIIGPKT